MKKLSRHEKIAYFQHVQYQIHGWSTANFHPVQDHKTNLLRGKKAFTLSRKYKTETN
jgi:hypothetical protein